MTRMRSSSFRWLLVLVAVAGSLSALLGACSSSDDERSADDAGRDPDAHDPLTNCVKPGTKNNDQGIGGYCQTHADCVPGVSLCTGAVGAPPNAYFCTRLCAKNPNCGDGLYCAVDDRGTVCVPYTCGIADASIEASSDAEASNDADAASDAGSDAASDAGSDAAGDAFDQ